ncbi:receptor-type tyrosine-protein phosphatase C isoform X2 [Cololabis saira]|uniref:receptor-type tyrosine-protein phosphatase C isoform X2 n=1 Tax=Cololabis saira TaxID=129043 RepID=UPI002AD49A0D|nr:receptor-type tyrosine-protein phosphatase C isoform X2 [Cololabis saira]
MAALGGLKTWALWAAIACLLMGGGEAQASNDNSTASDTQTNTTVPPPIGPCSYNVTTIKSGFQINVEPVDNATYTITINENVNGSPEKTETLSSPTYYITNLKPCTEYMLNVMITNSTEKVCGSTDQLTKTDPAQRKDIRDLPAETKRGYVCYQSQWDLSASEPSLRPQSNPTFPQTGPFCVQIPDKDFCSETTIEITQETCGNASITLARNITVDFIDGTKINQSKNSTQLHTAITPTLPSNCKNLTVEYICSETDEVYIASRPLSDLNPFTNYSCTGRLMNNNMFIHKTTQPVSIDAICDLQIYPSLDEIRDTTAVLRWNSTSKCNLSMIKKLSYWCSCEGGDTKILEPGRLHPEGRMCRFTKLTPFKEFICTVEPTFDGNVIPKSTVSITGKTKPGKPDTFYTVTPSQPDNNVIEVMISYSNSQFNGPEPRFEIQLLIADSVIKEIKTEKELKHTFDHLSYSTDYIVKVSACNKFFCSDPSKHKVTTRYNDKALIGFLIFLIILTSIALLLVLYKIYILKRRKSHDMSENMMLIPAGNDEETLLLVEPIAAEILLETYKRKLADEGRLFLAEFQSIPRIFARYTVKEAKKPCNVPKNRYVDILPYDYNRVPLATGNGEAGCDYINASFIDGYKEPKKYIAAQGPKEETISDFWRMIWEQQSSIIVMVTRCEEGNRVKCAQYWPSEDRDTEIFEEFIVKLTSEDQYPDYTIRRLSLTNKREKNSEREVNHIQFMSWPDHGVPGEPHLLLKLRRRVNAFNNFFSGPIVVHCSAGVGRTGTYIGIDAMMEGLEAEGRMDIYGYIVRLRRQRCLMVQVEAQYILIHQALLEHNQFGETEIALSELHGTLSTLKQSNADSEPTLMEEEFERLPSFKSWRTFNTGITAENKKRNRSSSAVPYDYNRVRLKLDEGFSLDSEHDEDEEESSDEEDEDIKYINASHIHGYWGLHALIAAQTPLPDTVGDFWTMVYQKKASAIVMLSGGSEGDEDHDSLYWDEDKKTFGDIEVEVQSTDDSPAVITRTMLIRHVKKTERRTVKHFQFLKWDAKELPEKPKDFADMIKDIKRDCGSSRSQKNVPVVVHCNNGSTRSGVFCALWNLIDSAETEKLVDVFQVVKVLRKERQGMLSNLEQYQFLYNALESTFPVQNGEVKPVQVAAADSVQIVSETGAAAAAAEEESEQPASTTSSDQQAAPENKAAGGDGGEKETKESMTPDQDSNGPTVTLEV